MPHTVGQKHAGRHNGQDHGADGRATHASYRANASSRVRTLATSGEMMWCVLAITLLSGMHTYTTDPLRTYVMRLGATGNPFHDANTESRLYANVTPLFAECMLSNIPPR